MSRFRCTTFRVASGGSRVSLVVSAGEQRGGSAIPLQSRGFASLLSCIFTFSPRSLGVHTATPVGQGGLAAVTRVLSVGTRRQADSAVSGYVLCLYGNILF